MTRMRGLLIGLSAILATGAGGVGASALMDLPQDATPTQDTTADLNRQSAEQAKAAIEAAAPREQAPEGAPAPAAPVPITPPVIEIETGSLADEEEPTQTAEAAPVATTAPPGRRQRMRVAVIEAVDKVTANRMRFEVPVGGRPVRFNKQLIFTARACDVSAGDEPVRDSIAYLEIAVQARGLLNAATSPREVFRGWMFASSPAISGLQHPTYDAWVVGCKA